MGKKVRLTESQLKQIIREAIENVTGVNPPPKQAAQPAPAPSQAAEMPTVNKNYVQSIEQAISEITNTENTIARFMRMPGKFFGIPEEKMPGFQRANQHLEMAKNELQTFLQ